MSLSWIFRVADRTHALFLPVLFMVFGCGLYGGLLAVTDFSFAERGLAHRHLLGTLALFLLLPAYLVAMLPWQHRLTKQALDELEAMARPEDTALVHARLARAPALSWIFVAMGSSIGLALNPLFIAQMFEARRYPLLDVAFIIGSCITWATIALVLCWRLPVSRALSRLGEHLELDLYRLDKLRPIARIANADVLAAAGAMAFMPLQSLDAEFRVGNYAIGFFVGAGAILLLFAMPLWGVHKRIIQAKTARRSELQARMERVDRGDITMLETLASHLDRVRALPNWPIDLQLVTRLFGYVILPPFAWAAAAMVENFIDGLS